LLHGRGKANYGFTAKPFKVSPVAVMKLMNREADGMPEPKMDGSIKEILFDGMQRFATPKYAGAYEPHTTATQKYTCVSS
jgi:hypothetical protein